MNTNRMLIAAGVILAVVSVGCKSGGGEELPTCTPGEKACACKTDGTCDTGLACQDNVCNEPACVAGTLDCPCRTGDLCDAGLVCQESTCKAQVGTGLVVGSPAARACDVVFNVAGAVVVISRDVTGAIARRDDRVSVSFAAKEDAAFTGPVAAVTSADGNALTGLTPEKAECYDRLGKAIADPGVEVQ